MPKTIDFRGIWIPHITPFTKEDVYKIDYSALAKLLDYLIGTQKADGIVAFGTTGENSTLEKAEIQTGIEFVIKHLQKRVPTLVATGTNNTKTTIEMTQFAEKAGANGALVVVPYYNRPNQKGLLAHFSAIAENTALPILIYNIPARTGVNLEPETMIALAQKYSNIVGVKDVSCDLRQTQKLIEAKKIIPYPFFVLSGEDCQTYANFEMGGDGAISASANVIGAEIQEMWQASQTNQKEKSFAIQQKLEKMFTLLFKEPNPAPIKACFDLMGLEFGGDLRLPLLKATENLRSELEAELQKLNKL